MNDWISRPGWDFILNRSHKRVIKLDESATGSWDITEFWLFGEGVDGVILFSSRGEKEARAVFEEIKEELCGLTGI
jgi:hypothetical protein